MSQLTSRDVQLARQNMAAMLGVDQTKISMGPYEDSSGAQGARFIINGSLVTGLSDKAAVQTYIAGKAKLSGDNVKMVDQATTGSDFSVVSSVVVLDNNYDKAMKRVAAIQEPTCVRTDVSPSGTSRF